MHITFQSILIPTDFSPSAWKAMRLGIDLARMYGARITVLHIVSSTDGQREEMKKEMFKQLENVRANMDKLSSELTEEMTLNVTNVVMTGNVNKTLLTFIEKHEFDLVIMGASSSSNSNTPGTHTIEVIENSKTPVLVVPNNYLIT